MDDESIFTLEQYDDQSGSHLDLIPVGIIDREKFKSAELKMTASNPSIPDQMDQSTTVTIHVTVLDENEFKPTFTKQVSFRKFRFIEIIILLNIRNFQNLGSILRKFRFIEFSLL